MEPTTVLLSCMTACSLGLGGKSTLEKAQNWKFRATLEMPSVLQVCTRHAILPLVSRKGVSTIYFCIAQGSAHSLILCAFWCGYGIVSTSNPAERRRMRALMSNCFAPIALQGQEPTIIPHVGKLIEHLRRRCGKRDQDMTTIIE